MGASAASTAANAKVRHIIGLDNYQTKRIGHADRSGGRLAVQDGQGRGQGAGTSIDDIFVGTETTQSGGKTGRVVKTAAMAAPYESGKVLTILMRTKVDILTVAFHDADGALHGAIFALTDRAKPRPCAHNWSRPERMSVQSTTRSATASKP